MQQSAKNVKTKRFSFSCLPLGPLNSLISTTVSRIGLLRRTYNRTMEPASFSASTALLCETSDTSNSFTLKIQSLTLQGRKRAKDVAGCNCYFEIKHNSFGWYSYKLSIACQGCLSVHRSNVMHSVISQVDNR